MAELGHSHSRKLGGNYSSLFVDFIVRRETGQYYLEYYIPSILLVSMSWVSFWLDPNAVPGRTTLGTSTWLTMITLTRNTGSDQLPKVTNILQHQHFWSFSFILKVNYVKFIDIWFLACTCFIFLSLLEFAVVNTIWRRKYDLTWSQISITSPYLLTVETLFTSRD